MNSEQSRGASSVFRLAVVLGMIALAAALRVLPHPWSLAPVGAMALFGGALLQDKRLALFVPLAALFAGDCVLGFYKLMPVVYASFLASVAIGFWLRERRTAARVAGAALLGALQFFVATNFAVWAAGGLYPRSGAGLAACYIAAIPFFWNTLAGDLLYSALLFGGFTLAERLLPALRTSPVRSAA